ncbi:MAG: hypothetical protein HY059_10175 [Proteobacteria bacterium]|nr:hypothetical protein [Pseudomonadota bacterium]
MLAWLLEESCPPARYLTQRLVLGLPEEVAAAARAKICDWEPVANLLAQQAPEGYWRHPEDCWWPKWTATTWPLLVLAELGAPGTDPRVKKACEFWLKTAGAQSREFPAPQDPKDPLAGFRSLWEPCGTGNMLRTLSVLGYGRDKRVLELAAWLPKHQLPDGGWNCTAGEWGVDVKCSSFCSTIEPLWGFASMDRSHWTPEVWHAVPGAVEFLLERFLYRSRRTGKIVDEEWTRLHFPLFYFYDILHALRVLADLELTQDGRDRDALSVLEVKRGADGRWRLEGDASRLEATSLVKTPGGWKPGQSTEPLELLDALGKVGEPSKFVTLHALSVLKRYGRWSPPDAG